MLTAVAGCLWIGALAPAADTDTQAEGRTAQAETLKPPKFRGRLPRYYGQVVNEKQRRQIYDIQRKYHERDFILRTQLKQLRAERDQEIEAVLSPEQKETLQKLLTEAARRRAARNQPAEK
jgi:Spy/CpxP family protein refolding chaperone